MNCCFTLLLSYGTLRCPVYCCLMCFLLTLWFQCDTGAACCQKFQLHTWFSTTLFFSLRMHWRESPSHTSPTLAHGEWHLYSPWTFGKSVNKMWMNSGKKYRKHATNQGRVLLIFCPFEGELRVNFRLHIHASTVRPFSFCQDMSIQRDSWQLADDWRMRCCLVTETWQTVWSSFSSNSWCV